jgi:quinol monooxygenase YgiN
LATNVDGQYLGAPELDTLFSVLNERKAIVILHPHRPEPVNKQVMQQTPLAMQEYLSETTRAVSNMISRNVLARYNNIKIIVPHCGAYLPLTIPRMKSLTPVMQANKMVGEIDYEANLRTLYYDLAGAHSPEVIRMLLTITTPDHLLYGSDYPYVAPQVLTRSLARMKDYLSKEPDLAPFKDMILWKNAKNLTPNPSPKGEGDIDFQGQQASTPLAFRRGVGGEALCRIAEIEVYPQYLKEYLAFANEVDHLSIEREPGVICLYPMQSAEDSCLIRILEIYASDEAYQQHLKTDHFQKYKQGTLHMVKDLKLPTMKPLDPETMKLIFKKQR